MNATGFSQHAVREAKKEDAEEIAGILAEAFAEDPVMNWIFRDRRVFKSSFLELARGIYLRSGFGHLAGGDAATLWLRAGDAPSLPFFNEMRLLFAAVKAAGLGGVKRAKGAAEAMATSHPEAPHYYLFAVGVRPYAQGKGLGGRLIREGLNEADMRGAPSYLENSNPKNTALYERLGFRATSPLALPADAPPLLGMLREARAS